MPYVVKKIDQFLVARITDAVQSAFVIATYTNQIHRLRRRSVNQRHRMGTDQALDLWRN
jgi:hypothetical protein